MQTLSIDQLIKKQNSDIDSFIANGWIFNPGFRFVAATDLTSKKVVAADSGVRELIDEIGLTNQLDYTSMPGLIDSIYSRCNPGQPLDSGIVINYLFERTNDELGFFGRLVLKSKYGLPGAFIIVTNNAKRTDGAKAVASSYLGIVQIPANTFDVDETKRIAKHEAGHVFGLLSCHHDTFDASGKDEAGYIVKGYEDSSCVMNSRPGENDNYLCDRCRYVVREKWKEVERRTNRKFLR